MKQKIVLSNRPDANKNNTAVIPIPQTVQVQVPVSTPEQTGVSGGYTISYQTDPTYITGTNAQFPSAPAPGQVVRVVAGNSQNDKQVYVIKLGNIIPNAEDENPTVKVEVGYTPDEARVQLVTATEAVNEGSQSQLSQPSNVGVGGTGTDAVLNDTASAVETEEVMDGVKEDENEPNPYLVVSPESVMAWTQSVGVDLTESDASTLGCLATNKLRNVILNAMQFSQNENFEGITVEHFRKAEELLYHVRGYGHESAFKETPYKYAAGVSVLDDGPEINLYAAVRQTNLSEIDVNEMEPTLFVHHLRAFDEKSEPDEFSNIDLTEEPVVVFCEHERMLAAENEQENLPTKSTPAKPTTKSTPSKSPLAPETVSNTPSTSAVDPPNEEEKRLEAEAEAAEETKTVENTVHDFLNEIQENSHPPPEIGEEINATSVDDMLEKIAPEWSPYVQLLTEHVVSYSYEDDFDCHISSALHHFIVDIRRNGAHPILAIVCSNFLDCLRNSRVSKSCVFNMVSVLSAFVNSDCQPTLLQMTQLAAVLIEIIILPPPCEVHQLLTSVFMKILKHCNELLTWTCTYVTEMLKMLTDAPIDEERESFKASLHGCLCLANGLEDLHIQVAQEFGWHTSVLFLSKTHSTMFEGKLQSGSTQDSFLEQEILKFFKNFINNYTTLVSPSELTKFREIVTALYGERYASFVPSNVVPKSIPNSNVKPFKKARCVFRKVTYKDKEVLIPCRRYVKIT